MPDPQIDKAQAAVLVENAHGLWIRAKNFVLTHEGLRVRKQWWFTQLARTTLVAAIITVALSGFGLSQESPDANDSSSTNDASVTSPADIESLREPPSRSNRVIWFLTAISATLAAIAKLGEQHIGRPEDIQSHLHAELLLVAKMDSLKLLVARIMGYYDGTQSFEIQDLSNQYDVLAVDVGEAGKLVGVTPDRANEPNAKEAIKGNSIDIAFSRVKTPEELPDNAVGIEAPIRGGGAA